MAGALYLVLTNVAEDLRTRRIVFAAMPSKMTAAMEARLMISSVVVIALEEPNVMTARPVL